MAVKISEFEDFLIIQEDDCEESPTEYVIGPCRLYKIEAYNKDEEINYLKLFDETEVVWGTTEPGELFPITAGDDTNWGFLTVDYLDKPRVFATGLSFAASNAGGKSTGTGPEANEVLVVLHVKRGVS